MPVPEQKPGRSKQNYATPSEFRCAIVDRFGFPYIDLAADSSNYFSSEGIYIGELNDSLSPDISWEQLIGKDRVAWLNPPYSTIGPWVKKCAEYAAASNTESQGEIVVLVPAAVGSNWFRDYVWGKANIYFLNGRIQFEGTDGPYPKDLMVLSYERLGPGPRTYVWDWKKFKVYDHPFN